MENHTSPRQVLQRFLKPNISRFVWASLADAMTVLLGYATPFVLAETIDCLLSGKPSSLPGWMLGILKGWGVDRAFFLGHLWVLAVILVLLYAVNGLFRYIRGRCVSIGTENTIRDLRDSLFNHLQRLPFSYHVHAQTGDLIQRCTSDIDTVRRFLAEQMLQIANALLMVAIALVILLQRHAGLTLFSVILTPLIFSFAIWFFRKVRKTFEDADETEGRLTSVLQENLSGVRVVRAFGQQAREEEKFNRVSDEFRQKAVRVNLLLAGYWSFGDFLSMAQHLLTLAVSIYLVINGEITVGTLVLFTNYVGQLLWPIRQLGRTLSSTGKMSVSLKRIHEILAEPVEPEEPDALKPDLSGDIVFDHVSFAYPDDGVPVLRDVSFTIPAGKTTAILGSTGSGKSTLMYLLQRLYMPTSGRITISGVDIREIDRSWLRSHVGLILQESFLYSRTIRENVGIALRDPTEKQVRHAAEVASAAGFIDRAEQGYETMVGERGVTLSGGQKQRIAIARTLLKDNQILVFDDSLSAVDTETDARIRQALREEQGRVTTLIISHRVTALSQADLILVMEDGRITAQGTHEQLIAQPGLYQRINSIQTGLEEEFLQEQTEVR